MQFQPTTNAQRNNTINKPILIDISIANAPSGSINHSHTQSSLVKNNNKKSNNEIVIKDFKKYRIWILEKYNTMEVNVQ